MGARQYCVGKDIEGTWERIAGLSPGPTGTISDGLTGTFTDTSKGRTRSAPPEISPAERT
jgi:hypothetical protein